ncbi:hypothetical protein HK102_006092 [Quaeritorhiza haematococci]|nr:hypothetical protein HK102_006092 [Quaeritorhiza haematococci]
MSLSPVCLPSGFELMELTGRWGRGISERNAYKPSRQTSAKSQKFNKFNPHTPTFGQIPSELKVPKPLANMYNNPSFLVATLLGISGLSSAAPSGILEKRISDTTNAIVGGDLVNSPEVYPWLTAIFEDGKPVCGGSLIAPNLVLTAAHCLDGYEDEPVLDPSHFRISTWRYNLRQPTSQEHGIDFKVLEYVQHPAWNSTTTDNDLAVMHVKPINLEHTTRPIATVRVATPADDRRSIRPQVQVTAAGWGLTRQGDRRSKSLRMREVKIPVVPNDRCQKRHPDSDIGPSVMCAGLNKGGKDTCQGDSGGPLFRLEKYADGSKEFVQYGVTSWGEGCGNPNKPGVYTRVSAFSDWIDAAIEYYSKMDSMDGKMDVDNGSDHMDIDSQ